MPSENRFSELTSTISSCSVLMLYVILVAGSIFMLYQTIGAYQDGLLLRASAEPVNATITRKVRYNSHRNRSTRFFIEYISPQDGSLIENIYLIDRTTYTQFNVGDTLPLMVATEDPETYIMATQYPPSPRAWLNYLPGLIASLFFAAAPLWLYLIAKYT